MTTDRAIGYRDAAMSEQWRLAAAIECNTGIIHHAYSCR